MITLNDYLYSGDTVLKILHRYSADLKLDAERTQNPADILHCDFLMQMIDILEHNDFISSQAQRIRELYKYMAKEYPFLSFTFKGRIKSLVRAEEKFNGRLVSGVYDYYEKNKRFPTFEEVQDRLMFRDLIAYRIVLSLPNCHLRAGEDRREQELHYLYELANAIPEFLEKLGFVVEPSTEKISGRLASKVKGYYKDYIEYPNAQGYQSLHLTIYDHVSRSHFELQLRTKEMDDHAEIGFANHTEYEKRQEAEREQKSRILQGNCAWYDDAHERLVRLQNLELKDVDVNMFTAASNILVNDGCGFYRGRQITPFEHLSRFQNDLVD